ncbi:MAG TPA: hypothetical protein PKD54_09070, partial [Pirellulaceae bacterium]|nr:hypothetical protein [Pirellulaceae bacterium]
QRSVESSQLVRAEASQWQRSSEVESLVERFQSIPAVARASELSFVATDPNYLRTQHQLGALAARVCASNQVVPYGYYREVARTVSDDLENESTLSGLFRALHPELSSDDAARLTAAFQMFDWCVRNIQLDEPSIIPPDEWESTRLSEESHSDPAWSGILGLGYRRLVGQVLLYGRGDYVERAKLFLALCDQQDLPAVLLSIGDRPWAVGVMIGNQVYLFDTRLGLPLPGRTLGSIATWEEVKEHSDLLTGLDLSLEETTRSDVKYWVRPEELSGIQAGVWVTPESESHRMRYLEDRLVGDMKLKLTTGHTRAVERCRELLGVEPTLMDWEFRTHAFRHAVRSALSRSAYDDELGQRLAWYFEQEYYIDTFNMYRTARHLMAIGRFEVDRDGRRLSAIEYFYNLIYTDEMIDSLGLNETLMRRLGILQKQQSRAEFEATLRSTQQSMRIVRRDAGLFLSQALFDNNNWGTAENWLGRINQQVDMETWQTGIQYALARARESVRDYPAALEILGRSDGAQFHGNIVRARSVKQATRTGLALSQ